MGIKRTEPKILNISFEKVANRSGPRFETSDLALASFLYCRNFPFIGVERGGDGRPICVFFDSPELRHAVIDYANDGIVPVRTFCMTMKDLRSITR